MTAQASEYLKINGEEVAMLSTPLEDYFEQGGQKPRFVALSSALWRGYVGTWEIVADRLYLTEITGKLYGGGDASLTSVFPDATDRVFAHWYSGQLRLPQGRRLRYVHMGYSSSYERDVLLTIQSGVLVSEEVRVNGVAEEGAPEGYRIGSRTIWPIS
jgi:hypothetical protein